MCSFTVLGVPKASQYLVWLPFASCSVTHILRIELIRLLIVECFVTPLQWLCKVAGYWQELEPTVVYGRSRASQTCSMGDMSGEYAGHARTGMFSASRNCVQILATWGYALSCIARGWMAQQWASGSCHGISVHSKCQSMSITYACPYHNPTATMGHSIHKVDISKPLTHTDAIHAVCHLPCTVKTRIHPWR